MIVTKANPTDIPELNTLINSAYRGEISKNGWTTEAEILDGIRINEETLATYFEQSNVSILKCSNEVGEIIGTVYLELNTPKLYLGMFAVSPFVQGKGIGKMLLKEAEELALTHHCDRIAISVISNRAELIEWYKRHGYEADGHSIAFEEIENRFGDPKIDEIRLISMEKLLV
jgi:ribosomal protein S18 acetylase RimI-like enzyme